MTASFSTGKTIGSPIAPCQVPTIHSPSQQSRPRFSRPNWRQDRYWRGRRVVLRWCVFVSWTATVRRNLNAPLQNRSKMRYIPGCGTRIAGSWRWRITGRRIRTTRSSSSHLVGFRTHITFSCRWGTDGHGRSGGRAAWQAYPIREGCR